SDRKDLPIAVTHCYPWQPPLPACGERVGVKGRFRLPQTRGVIALRHCEPTGPARSGRPDDRLREAIQSRDGSSGLLRRYAPRNDEIKSHSRDAIRARVMPYNASITPLSRIASGLSRRWDRFRLDHALRLFEHDLFGKPVSTFPDHARQTKRKRNAARRMSSDGPHRRQVYAVCANHLLRARRAPNAARSPDGVPLRYLLQRANAAT